MGDEENNPEELENTAVENAENGVPDADDDNATNDVEEDIESSKLPTREEASVIIEQTLEVLQDAEEEVQIARSSLSQKIERELSTNLGDEGTKETEETTNLEEAGDAKVEEGEEPTEQRDEEKPKPDSESTPEAETDEIEENIVEAKRSESRTRVIYVDEKDKLSQTKQLIEIKEARKSSRLSFIEAPEDKSDFEDDKRDSEELLIKPTVIISGFDLLFEDEEVEEESTESSESIPSILDRIPYYQMYIEIMEDYGLIKRLNNFLHRKMADYFKKRKMEHIMRESDHLDEFMMKYTKKLETFSRLIEIDRKQRDVIMTELQILKSTRNVQYKEAENIFEEFLNRELEIGTGLINSKTGKEIPEKYMEKLIKSQRQKAKELYDLLLLHIKIRNAVAEKIEAIRAIDKIGETCTLIEFEQLKIENQSHSDKIEEKDEELSRLRRKCQEAIQCLAHLREKCSAVEINIAMMKVTMQDKEIETSEVREEVNSLKQQRDNFRSETQRLKVENGLLANDKLLIDLEESMKKVAHLEKLLEESQANFDNQTAQLKAIKTNIEREKKRRRLVSKSHSIKEAKSRKPSYQIYKGRPTLIYPQFETPINPIKKSN